MEMDMNCMLIIKILDTRLIKLIEKIKSDYNKYSNGYNKEFNS